MERKLAAILAADVVGYSRLMEQDEARTFERLKAHRIELVEPEIKEHRGCVFKLMGDGILAEFGSVVDAVECAVDIQRGMAERNTGVPEDQRIDVRIGVNLGEVIVEGADRHGEGVNIAARLQQLADPGGICVSGKVANEVEKKLAFGFEPMGAQKVKNISEPIPVYRVRLDGARARSGASPRIRPDGLGEAGRRGDGYRRRRRRVLVWPPAVAVPLGSATHAPSIAVLPFDDLSPDKSLGYLGDGVSEDIITMLSRFPDLSVIARNSSFVYKGKPVDIRQVGRELNVGYALEGSVRKEADQIRIIAQLIDAQTGKHVWAERYDKSGKDPLDTAGRGDRQDRRRDDRRDGPDQAGPVSRRLGQGRRRPRRIRLLPSRSRRLHEREFEDGQRPRRADLGGRAREIPGFEPAQGQARLVSHDGRL